MKPADFFILHNGISTSITRGYNFNCLSLSLSRIDVDITTLCVWSTHRPVCLTVLLFSFVGHASLSFGTCVSRLLFK